MPKKDKLSDTEPKKYVKKVQKDEEETKQTTVESKKYVKKVQEEEEEEQEENDMDFGKKKSVLKPGRTILISAPSGSTVPEAAVTNLDGLTKSFSTKNGSYFLTFDTIENAVNCHKKLKQNYPNLKDKFARYQIFFTLNGLTDDDDYTTVKKLVTEYVEQKTSGIVLYFKLYRKGDKYFFDKKGDKGPIGYGDLTIDTKESMDLLLNKEGPLKNYTIQMEAKEITIEKDGKKESVSKKAINLSGTFYRFNKNPKNETSQKAYLG